MKQGGLQNAIKSAREKAGLTRAQLAERAGGLNRLTVLRLETGRTPHPRTDTLSAIATALGVTVDELLKPEPKRRRANQRGSTLVDALFVVAIVAIAVAATSFWANRIRDFEDCSKACGQLGVGEFHPGNQNQTDTCRCRVPTAAESAR